MFRGMSLAGLAITARPKCHAHARLPAALFSAEPRIAHPRFAGRHHQGTISKPEAGVRIQS